MPIKKIALLICLIMLLVGCTDENDIARVDDNYSDDHAVNVERCLQSLEDGTAYEIDEELTAQAPWKPGAVVVKFRDGEGGYYLREFLGITKAGYYLVQDYRAGVFNTSYPRYNPKTITNQIKMTEPFALMSCSAVTNEKSRPVGMAYIPSVCGTFTNYYAPKVNEVFVQVKEQGLFLDGAKHGEWVRYYSNGNLESKTTYDNNILTGVSLRNNYNNNKLRFFSYSDYKQNIFTLIFNDDGQVKEIKILETDRDSAFVDYDEDSQTIRHGYWLNGKKTGLWRTWSTQGVLLEKIDHSLQP